ncbi:hypothetical protein IVB46_16735 [Bradyrhizobium sp. 61]|uniref:hypothetical protein n=1 Tax=Bradyrhizobium sp. 61 TaxID=2782679 RepID=UPI001FFBD7F2|nr:hypothetical protein [Bradyrhizobium sp. 61]MCK1276870.1 hypothetical protein [Bradyrhizobium sp. 61]
MKIVDEDGEIIATASDDHTLIGGHHRLAVAASLGKRLFWRDTGEPVKPSTYSLSRSPSVRCSVHRNNANEDFCHRAFLV